MQLIAIAMGGSLGAIVRFGVANGIYGWLGREFPHGTLFVNVSGSFLMGFLSVMMLQRFPLAVEYRAAALVGFLGAYTTFSTFALETLNLFEGGHLLKAILNVFLSVVLCLVAVWIGSIVGRQWFETNDAPWAGLGSAYRGIGFALLFLFVLTLFAEWLFLREQVSAPVRAVGLITLLGLVTMASTLWLALTLADFPLELSSLLSAFLINALLAAAAIWLGLSCGQWLQQSFPH